MKKVAFILTVVAFFASSCNRASQQHQQVEFGSLDIYENFKSESFPPRNILVWLPEGYDSNQKYSVLYMHDAQMIFDQNTSWNKQSWNIDCIAHKVITDKSCRPFIVVGIENHPTDRLTEYMPEKALDYLPQDNALLKKFDREKFIADDYLKFIVCELKPFIDSKYSTLTDAVNTAVIGSSMGGLISLYALCEYPKVFGAAACLSTHSPVAIDDIENQAPTWSKAFRDYLSDNLPAVGDNRVYMDCGDKTIDAAYPPYQAQIDSLFAAKGWNNENFTSLFFKGHAHDENSWQKRLHVPLRWVFGGRTL